MGHGASAMSTSLARQFQLTPAERRRYLQPFQDLAKQGRHEESIKRILKQTLDGDRVKAAAKNVGRPPRGTANISTNARQSVKAGAKAVANERSNNPATAVTTVQPGSGLGSPSKVTVESTGAATAINEGSAAIVAAAGQVDNANEVSANPVRQYSPKVKSLWNRVVQRLLWQSQLKKSVVRLFPYGSHYRRIQMKHFRCLFADVVHCICRVHDKNGNDSVISRDVFLCLVLHEGYEERKYVAGLSPIIEIVGFDAQTGNEVAPRLFISVSVLRSMLLQQLHREVHVQMRATFPALGATFSVSDAAKAISVAAQALIANCAKQGTTQAVDQSACSAAAGGNKGESAHIVGETQERSRFAVWFDRVQRRRVSVSKVSSGEFIAGIRRGSRSYSTILTGINKSVRRAVGAAPPVVVSSAHDGSASIQPVAATNERRHLSAAELEQDTRNHFVNSVVFGVMVKYVTSNIHLSISCIGSFVTAKKYSANKSASLAPEAPAVHYKLTLEPPVLPKPPSSGNGDTDEDAACLSQKESLFVPDHVSGRFISPARVCLPPYIQMHARCPCEQSIASQFVAVSNEFSSLATAAVEQTSKASSLANVHGPIFDCSRDRLNVRSKWDAHGNFHPSLQDNPSIQYDDISRRLTEMLVHKLEAQRSYISYDCETETDDHSAELLNRREHQQHELAPLSRR
jgi:hypothetical protein